MSGWIWLSAGIVAAGAAWFSLKYAWWRKTVSYDMPRVLMYHMIRSPLAGGKFNKMRVSPALFERQVKWLVEHGWKFHFLSEIVGQKLETKSVVLTFDDGYRDNYLNSFPVLKKYGVKATLFPVVKRDAGYDWSASKKANRTGGELGREEKLADAEIREMLASGLIELGGHTLTHANLPELDETSAREEIRKCKEVLERTFDVKVATFCYPFGLFGKREVLLVRDAGFSAATTTEQGISMANAWELPRVKVSGTEGMFAFRLRLRTGRRN